MTKAEAIARLLAHEADLRAMGIERLSLFGSTARGDEREGSDVDVAATFDRDASMTWSGFFAIEERLREVLGVSVDLVSEPSARARFQRQIDQDRVLVF